MAFAYLALPLKGREIFIFATHISSGGVRPFTLHRSLSLFSVPSSLATLTRPLMERLGDGLNHVEMAFA
jgi:hypothetical protein